MKMNSIYFCMSFIQKAKNHTSECYIVCSTLRSKNIVVWSRWFIFDLYLLQTRKLDMQLWNLSMKQKGLSDVCYSVTFSHFHLLTVCVHSSLYKFYSRHLIDIHLYKCFTCLDINKQCLNHIIEHSWFCLVLELSHIPKRGIHCKLFGFKGSLQHEHKYTSVQRFFFHLLDNKIFQLL